jgi:hypothetical protein
MSTVQHHSCHPRFCQMWRNCNNLDSVSGYWTGDKIVWVNRQQMPWPQGDKSGLPWLPTLVAQFLILLEANQFGETAMFRLSLRPSIMKILFTPTAMLDHGFGAFGSHKNHVCHTTPSLGPATVNTADGQSYTFL